MRTIIDSILKGEIHVFDQIVTRFNEQFLKIAFHYTQNWENASDITQDTFVKTFRNLKSFDQTKSFDPWIYKIHINSCKNFVRKQKLKRLFFGKYKILESDDIPNDIQPILDCVNLLSFKQKTAFILMELEGQSSKDAAQIMDCKAETARVHLSRAKTNLKKQLTQLGYHE
jgi:RNA polymerase sigma-70 factor (ECF subfamily)